MSEHALKIALEFAAGAIQDAIYTEDGLDGLAGEQVLCLIVEALKYGTHDARKVERPEMVAFFGFAADTEPR